MMALVTRVLGESATGLLSICLALSLQLITVGEFSMNQYEASDALETYSFSDYIMARIYSVSAMILAGISYVVFTNSPQDKSAVLFLFLLQRASESISGAFGARYQQKGRFDLTCKVEVIKNISSVLIFSLVLFTFHNLVCAIAGAAITHILFFPVFDWKLADHFGGFNLKKLGCNPLKIIAACFPTAICLFLFVYISTGPKIAIEAKMTAVDLALFSAIFFIPFAMTSFGNLISGPKISIMASFLANRAMNKFINCQLFLLFLLAATALFGTVCAWFWGVPIINTVFKMDVSPFRNDICILLAGGLILSVAQLAQLTLIIARRQAFALIGISASALFTFLAARPMVAKSGIHGASMLFLYASCIVCFFNCLVALLFVRHLIRKPTTADSAAG